MKAKVVEKGKAVLGKVLNFGSKYIKGMDKSSKRKDDDDSVYQKKRYIGGASFPTVDRHAAEEKAKDEKLLSEKRVKMDFEKANKAQTNIGSGQAYNTMSYNSYSIIWITF